MGTRVGEVVCSAPAEGSNYSSMKRSLPGLRGHLVDLAGRGKCLWEAEASSPCHVSLCLHYSANVTKNSSPWGHKRGPKPSNTGNLLLLPELLLAQSGNLNETTQRALWHHACLPTSHTEGGNRRHAPLRLMKKQWLKKKNKGELVRSLCHT